MKTAVYEHPILTIFIVECIACEEINYVSQITWTSWTRWRIAKWAPILIYLANETEQAKKLPHREDSYNISRLFFRARLVEYCTDISSPVHCMIIIIICVLLVCYRQNFGNTSQDILLFQVPGVCFLISMLSSSVLYLQPLLVLHHDPKILIIMALQATIMIISHSLILKFLIHSVPLSFHAFDFTLNTKSTLRSLAYGNLFRPKDSRLAKVYSPARPLLKLALLNDKLNHVSIQQRYLTVRSIAVHGCLMTEADIRLLKLAARIAKSYFYTLDLIERHGSQAPHRMVGPKAPPCIIQPVSNHMRSTALGPCGAHHNHCYPYLSEDLKHRIVSYALCDHPEILLSSLGVFSLSNKPSKMKQSLPTTLSSLADRIRSSSKLSLLIPANQQERAHRIDSLF